MLTIDSTFLLVIAVVMIALIVIGLWSKIGIFHLLAALCDIFIATQVHNYIALLIFCIGLFIFLMWLAFFRGE